MKKRDFTSARAKEALLKDKDKYCGECCWFYAEDTDGYGMCPLALMEQKRCDEPCTNGKFVSGEDLRHYLAVLLVEKRWMDDDMFIHYAPDGDEVCKAIDFAYKYIKIFSEL